ncbi:MAG: ABC transporter ATP-binding protein [Candidatus Methanosuratus sp.]|nr:ABC transporter ATP-binding protein [Candidatus Methanosuratincola sp.]
MLAVEVKDLVKDYGSFRVLKGISFDVDEGVIFGLIGPNAAGKTTALRIISTLLQITSGSVKVFGHDVIKEAGQVRQLISYLPEDAGAYKDLTGKRYLEFIAAFFKDGNKTKKMVERGMKIADLGERINDKVDTYSKGMIRRLLVGRALMMQPRLAVLDEPTSGLDVVNAQEVRKIIQDAVKDGTTILLSSHNMFEVDFLCSHIALINEGKIVEEGSPHELKEKYNAANLEEVFAEVVK